MQNMDYIFYLHRNKHNPRNPDTCKLKIYVLNMKYPSPH